MGALSPNGLLRIAGRIGEITNLSSVKVAPSSIEAVVARYVGSTEAAAFSAPDPSGVEQPWVGVARGDDIDLRVATSDLTSRFPEMPQIRFSTSRRFRETRWAKSNGTGCRPWQKPQDSKSE